MFGFAKVGWLFGTMLASLISGVLLVQAVDLILSPFFTAKDFVLRRR